MSLINERHKIETEVTATLAEINAGKVLVPGRQGKTIVFTSFAARVTGTFTTCTAIVLADDASSPVTIQSIAVAAAGDGEVLKDGTTNVTRGAGMWGNLTQGVGIKVTKTGSSAAGGTSITFFLGYHYL
jgi:hypothetical protein